MVDRAFDSTEVKKIVQELFDNKHFTEGVQRFTQPAFYEYFIKIKNSIDSIESFQAKLIYVFLQHIKKTSIQCLSHNGLNNFKKDKKYLIISNHRDIILDSAFLNSIFFENNMTTCQIAIGDNLMKHRISELLFKINKSFVVKRSGTPREIYSNALALSKHIHETVLFNKDSVWIAQREGRAKDGNDSTQIALLKMLSLIEKKDLKTFFQKSKIVPLTISYELDPCALLKTKEHLVKLKNPNFKKTFKEDQNSMLLGLSGDKGSLHYSFAQPLNEELEILDKKSTNKEKIETLVNIIDTTIYKNYKFFPINYYAYDLLNKNHQFLHLYQSKITSLQRYFDDNFKQIPEGNRAIGRAYFLGIYANPLKNSIPYMELFNKRLTR